MEPIPGPPIPVPIITNYWLTKSQTSPVQSNWFNSGAQNIIVSSIYFQDHTGASNPIPANTNYTWNISTPIVIETDSPTVVHYEMRSDTDSLLSNYDGLSTDTSLSFNFTSATTLAPITYFYIKISVDAPETITLLSSEFLTLAYNIFTIT